MSPVNGLAAYAIAKRLRGGNAPWLYLVSMATDWCPPPEKTGCKLSGTGDVPIVEPFEIRCNLACPALEAAGATPFASGGSMHGANPQLLDAPGTIVVLLQRSLARHSFIS
eukprot:scaffold24017_cov82-Phaeocystis_antarctica.AAC.8